MSESNQFDIIDDVQKQDENEEVVITSEEHKGHSHNHHHSHHGHNHHSHHHSGHHGNKKHKSKKNLRKKKLHLSKKDKKNLAIIATEVAVALLAIIIMFAINHFKDSSNEIEKENVVIDSGFVVKMPELNAPQVIVDETVVSCMKLDDEISFQSFLKPFRRDGLRFDKAVPVKLELKYNNIPNDEMIFGYRVYVSKNADLSNARVLDFTTDEDILIDLLEVNTKYYYRVIALPTDYSIGGSFTTAQSPRILNIDGIYNVRDIGGWKTVSGDTIKQGLLYRGTELDGQVNSLYKLSDKGKNTMLNVLNIKFDMDLRHYSDNKLGIDPLGNTVVHKFYGAGMYAEIFTEKGKISTKNIFSDLAKPENYPMYVHCTHGADRAGTICYLLEALLGLSEADLEKEYELSTLYHSHISRDLLNELKTGLMMYEGKTIQKKTENYLLSIGVTEEEIQTIKNIFLEESK